MLQSCNPDPALCPAVWPQGGELCLGTGALATSRDSYPDSSIPAYDGGLALPGNFSQRLVENAEGLDMSLDFTCLRGGFHVCSSHQSPGLDDSEANSTFLMCIPCSLLTI